jgi:hypothetical protein
VHIPLLCPLVYASVNFRRNPSQKLMEAFQQKRLAEKIIQKNWKTPVRSLPH